MKAAISIVVILLSGGACAIAQENLIRNWSFEELQFPQSEFPCPTSSAAISQTTYWNSAWRSVDYFNACSNEDWPLWGVPSNFYGAQRPYDGLAYVALATFTPLFSEGREYLWQPLERPLETGKGYEFSMWVSLNDSANFSTGHFGALFTFTDTQAEIDQMLGHAPQVESDSGVQFNSKVDWVEIQGEFIAQGGESYVVIGNFRPDSLTEFDRVSNIPYTNVSHEVASYYIDAITLHEVSGVGLEEQSSIDNEQLTVWPNPATHTVRIEARQPLQRLRLLDMLGQEVLNLKPETLNHELNIAHLPPGLYTVEAHTQDGRVAHQRVVKVDGP